MSHQSEDITQPWQEVSYPSPFNERPLTRQSPAPNVATSVPCICHANSSPAPTCTEYCARNKHKATPSHIFTATRLGLRHSALSETCQTELQIEQRSKKHLRFCRTEQARYERSISGIATNGGDPGLTTNTSCFHPRPPPSASPNGRAFGSHGRGLQKWS